MTVRIRRAVLLAALAILASLFAAPALVPGPAAAAQDAAVRTFHVTASRYTFSPGRIEVFADDVVSIQLRTDDIAHSFTVDDYRIAKRVSPGQTVTFEFRAERTGTFPFYCDLQAEDGCRDMRGLLVVRPRP